MIKRGNILIIISLIIFIPAYGFSQDSVFQTGKASYYKSNFDGKITASGEIYSESKLTAAHKTLPFGTFVKVTNLENDKTVIVLINDRGPYFGDRIIDISKHAAIKLGSIHSELTDVNLEIVEEGYDGENMITEDTSKEVPPVDEEFYKLNTKQYLPSGYGVQIASYAEIANLMRIANKVNAASKKDLIIQVINIQNSKVYRLILGTFKNREEASKYRSSILDIYPDCFIIEF